MSHARRGLRDITNAGVDAKPAKRGLRDITNTAVDAKPAKRGLRDVTNQPHPDKPRKRLSPAAACENRDAAPTVRAAASADPAPIITAQAGISAEAAPPTAAPPTVMPPTAALPTPPSSCSEEETRDVPD